MVQGKQLIVDLYHIASKITLKAIHTPDRWKSWRAGRHLCGRFWELHLEMMHIMDTHSPWQECSHMATVSTRKAGKCSPAIALGRRKNTFILSVAFAIGPVQGWWWAQNFLILFFEFWYAHTMEEALKRHFRIQFHISWCLHRSMRLWTFQSFYLNILLLSVSESLLATGSGIWVSFWIHRQTIYKCQAVFHEKWKRAIKCTSQVLSILKNKRQA